MKTHDGRWRTTMTRPVPMWKGTAAPRAHSYTIQLGCGHTNAFTDCPPRPNSLVWCHACADYRTVK